MNEAVRFALAKSIYTPLNITDVANLLGIMEHRAAELRTCLTSLDITNRNLAAALEVETQLRSFGPLFDELLAKTNLPQLAMEKPTAPSHNLQPK